MKMHEENKREKAYNDDDVSNSFHHVQCMNARAHPCHDPLASVDAEDDEPRRSCVITTSRVTSCDGLITV